MTNPSYTAIAVVVDRSGSMWAIRSDAEGAVNAFVEQQRSVPGKCTVRLSQFDTVYEEVYPSTDINEVKNYVLEPRGGTALTDAIGKIVTDFGAELAALPEDERPGNVIVVVVTDGFENASREYTAESVKSLIDQQEQQYGWDFVFLAAGQDAIATGATYGFKGGSSLSFDAGNVGVAMAASSLYVTNKRSGNKDYEFTDEDRKKAVDKSTSV